MEMKINGNEIVDEVIEKLREQIIRMGLNEVNPPPANLDMDEDNKALLYNGSIINAGNIHRIGNAEVISQPLDTKIRSAFGVLDVLSDYDTDLFRQGIKIAEQGHIQFTVDNITVYQVYKLDHLSQTLTLDEYELFVGEVDSRLTGFGEESEEYNDTFNRIVDVAKDPLLKIFNVTFKAMINAILISVQTGAKSG